MTKARDIADFKFEDIVDTGTEGTRVASGTTAERGSTAGQLRFNSETGLAEYYTGTAFKSIDSPPTVSGVGASNITETQISSNYDLSITGSSFNSGATVKFIGANNTEYASPTVTVNSDTSITARVPTSVTNANEPFSVKVTNTSGLSNTLGSAFNVDAKPVWQTASGNINSNIFDDESSSTVHATVSATDDEGDTVSYSEVTSTLSGAGFSLNSSNGQITGDPNNVSSDTTVSFDLRATSGTQTTDRSFSMTVKPGLITTGLTHYYNFASGLSYSGSGSTVTNLISGGDNASLYNSPTYDSSTGTMGFNLSGYSQRQSMRIPTVDTNVYCIQMLVEFTAQNDGGARSYIMDGRDNSGGDVYWLFDYDASGSNQFTINSGGGEQRTAISGGVLNLGYKVFTFNRPNNTLDGFIDTTHILNPGGLGTQSLQSHIDFMDIERGNGDNDYQARGRIKAILFYETTSLTTAQITQNVNYLKAKF